MNIVEMFCNVFVHLRGPKENQKLKRPRNGFLQRKISLVYMPYLSITQLVSFKKFQNTLYTYIHTIFALKNKINGLARAKWRSWPHKTSKPNQA